MSLVNVAQTVEGLLYGIIKAELPAGALDQCLGEAVDFQSHLEAAVQLLSTMTFSGVKQGLNEAGTAIGMVPEIVAKCDAAAHEDYSLLIKMVLAFQHPWSLVWNAGKNLIVNGADIFGKI